MHDFLQLILQMLRYGGRRFLATGCVCLVLAGIIYLLRRRQGKPFSWKKAVAAAVLAGYLAVLLYVTLLRQVGLGTGQVNWHLFRAWREAWNTFSLQNWLNVLLNIALLVPLGVLLPLMAKCFQRWLPALAAGLGTTLVIESAQYVLGRGMLDVDDLFANTLGALLGWCGAMAAATWRERKGRPYLVLPAVFCLALGGIFGCYQWKEYGNLPEAPAFAADLRGVEWQVAAEGKDTGDTVPTYWAEPFTKETCGAFGEEFARRAGTTFPDAYYYDDLTMFANHSTGDFLNVWYHDRSYDFTAASPSGPVGAEGEESLLREKLAQYGVSPPEEAEFAYEGSGWHRFRADFLPRAGAVVNGELRCRYLENGQLKEIENSMAELTPYGEVEILTEREALARLRRGLFQGAEGLEHAKVRRVEVLSWKLTYRADTKGFYQPVYEFTIRPEGMERGTVLVPAMK